MVDRHSNSSSSSSSTAYYSSNHPSFSSTLLDAIYRSIDSGHEVAETAAEDQRACMIDAWMMQKKKAREDEDKWIRGNMSDLKVKTSSNTNHSLYSSSISSSDVFSSWEVAELNPVRRPKPVRIGHCSGFQQTENFAKTRVFDRCVERGSEPKQKPKQESGFLKTKSRALKMYGDLKKAKQPISPGKKLAGFLNSLFSNNGSEFKRSNKIASRNDEYSPSMKSTVTTTTNSSSTCSSASSFSRSCLSKTPSSSRKSSTNKGSVRFSSVSMIIDEDSPQHQSLERKSSNERSRNIKAANSINEEIMVRAMEKNRRVDEVARDLLRNYHKSHVDDDGSDDDCASYASSDLFELDNLSSIGLMEKVYADDELPVYETTHLQNNRAFANGTTMVV